MFVPNTLGALFSTVIVTAQSFAVMTAQKYQFTSTSNCWIKQDVAANSPVASAGAGSMFVPALSVVYLVLGYGNTLSVIRDSADGKASLTEVVELG